jgi:uncharacterized protein YcbK (DUF882 family)
MITLQELNPKNFPVKELVAKNLLLLLDKMNIVRKAYGKPMIVSSGLRTMPDHLRIYANKGITDKNKIPMKSKHLFGQACDISDPSGKLMAWCKANVAVLEEAGLWCEDGTVGWVHFQSVPPGSGKRFFLP